MITLSQCLRCKFNNCKNDVKYDVHGCFILCLLINEGDLRPFVYDDEYHGLMIKECPLMEAK